MDRHSAPFFRLTNGGVRLCKGRSLHFSTFAVLTVKQDYTVLITCTDQLLATSTPSYELRFSRVPRTLTRKSTVASNTEILRPHTPKENLSFSQGISTPVRSITATSSQATLVPDLEADEDELYNPHEDAEPFLRHLLRHGPLLASSLHELVRILRDSLPVVCAVEEIRQSAPMKRNSASQHRDKPAVKVDTLVKAAGWYRVVYGDMRYAQQIH
jgi:mediator of RNA polymerase II transcription subunit 14